MKRASFIAASVALITVAAIVSALVIRHHHTETAINAAGVTGSESVPLPASQKAPQKKLVAKGDTSTVSAKVVQAAYTAYLRHQGTLSTPSRDNGADAIRDYLTADLYQKLKTDYASGRASQDEFICSQAVPSAALAGSTSPDPNIVTVVEQVGQTTPSFTVMLSGDKLSAIDCSS